MVGFLIGIVVGLVVAFVIIVGLIMYGAIEVEESSECDTWDDGVNDEEIK